MLEVLLAHSPSFLLAMNCKRREFAVGFAVSSAISSAPEAEIRSRVKSCDGQACTALSGCGLL